MSTNKSLKYLQSKDKFLLANVSNYLEKHSGRDSSSYIQQTDQATEEPFSKYEKNYEKPKRSMRNRYTFVAATLQTGTIQTCG